MMIDLPVTEETAQRALSLLSDPDAGPTVEITFGTDKALGRWHVMAARKGSGPDGNPQHSVTLAWAGE